MKNKNWSKYTPDEPKHGEGFMYLQDEEGNDWYDSYPKFKKKYKFRYDTETGVITSVSENAGLMYVCGFSVADTDTLPDGFDIFGGWIYNGKKIIPNVEHLQKNAELQRGNLSSEAESRIKLLERAARLGIATDAEKSSLDAWELYSIALSRVDTSTAPDVKWPVMPQ